MTKRESGQTWIRVCSHESDRAVCVWVCLEGNRMLCIRENGQFFVTDGADDYVLDKDRRTDIMRFA